MISAARLRELLDYEPTTGVFRWRIVKGRSFIGDKAGSIRHDGYIRIKLDQVDYLAHRLAWLWTMGRPPAEIDHIDGNPSNNSIANLRECTRRQNLANRRHGAKRRSLPKGVRRFHKRYGARIMIQGVEVWLGMFSSPEAASAAYMRAAWNIYGEFAFSGEIVQASRER